MRSIVLTLAFLSSCLHLEGRARADEPGRAGAGDLGRAEELGTKIGDSQNSVARKILEEPEDPDRFELGFPAFLVGVEKARRSKIGPPGMPQVPDLDLDLGEKAEDYIKNVTFSNIFTRGFGSRLERMFVSHLVEFARPDGGRPSYSPVIRYSAYSQGDLPSARDAYEEGRRRLLGLRRPLEEAMGRERPSHLIVFSTGWNTGQEGTFEGMKKLREALAKAAGGRDFRPLMVGISWPSMSERLAVPLAQATYQVKSCDADEVGLVWASTLVDQVLVPSRDALARDGRLTRRPEVIVIGHSFGARVATWPAFCGGLRPAGEADAAKGRPDVVIGLQGAFSAARFVEGVGIEGSPFAEKLPQIRFFYTCSENDRAVETFNRVSKPIDRAARALAARVGLAEEVENLVIGVPHIGGITAFRLHSEKYLRAYEHRTVAPDGSLDRALPATGEKVTLIDASSLIQQMPEGRAAREFVGAHGDIYNEGVGRLVWEIIASDTRPGGR